MRDYLNIIVVYYFVCCWSGSIYFFIANRKKHRQRFGNLWLPVVIFTGVFSPGLIIVEFLVSLWKRLLGK